jgi:hypothetical protein
VEADKDMIIKILTIAFMTVVAVFWPICGTAPTPHIHMQNGSPSASCPKGWVIHISQEASDAYNKVRTRDAAINLLADAPCIREVKP